MAGNEEDEAYRCAAALRRALRRFESRCEEIARANGLTSRQYLLLLLIRGSQGGTATVSGLVHDLRLGQSTVTELVQRAEEQGLIVREPSRTDGRVVHLSLSPEGERRLAGAFAELGEERSHLIELVSSL